MWINELLERALAMTPDYDLFIDVEIVDHDPKTLAFRAKVIFGRDTEDEVSSVVSFPHADYDQLVITAQANQLFAGMEGLVGALEGDMEELASWSEVVLDECFSAFEDYYAQIDLADYTARVNPERGLALHGNVLPLRRDRN